MFIQPYFTFKRWSVKRQILIRII